MKNAIKFIQIIALVISIFRFFIVPKTPDVQFMTVDLIIMMVLVLTFLKGSEISNRIIIKHSTIFIIGFVIVYYQFPLDYVLGNHNAIHYLDQPYLSEFCKGVVIANMSLSAFLLGHESYRGSIAPNTNACVNLNSKIIDYTVFVCLILFVIFVNKQFLFRGYGIYEKGALADELGKIVQMGLIASLVINSIKHKSNGVDGIKDFYKKFRIPIIVLLVYSGLIAMSGARYVVLRMLSLLFISYIYTVRPKIRIITLVLGLSFIAFLTTLQGLTRSGDEISFSEARNSMSQSESISPMTSELAFSVTTLHVATENVPAKVDYNYGVTFLSGLLFVIPGARTFVLNMLDIPIELSHSTMFITKLGYGSLDEGGMGSSSLADIYISFGVIGCVVIFLLFGYLIRYLEENTYKSNGGSTFILGISFCFYSQMMYLNRESLTTCLVGLPYVLLFIYVALRRSR